jgi:hypothetical protein
MQGWFNGTLLNQNTRIRLVPDKLIWLPGLIFVDEKNQGLVGLCF